jgi:chromatin remodeling complex protein RSC6
MPRQSKSKTEVSETTPAVNTTAVNTPAVKQTAVKEESGEKSVKSKQPKTKPVENVVAPVAPVVDTVVDTAVEAVDTSDLAAQSTEFLAKLNQLGSLFATLKTEFRSLEKKWSRELKSVQKSQSKRKRKSGNRQPSGFVKPTKISDELATFLEKPVGTEMARTDVTREINTYIRAHKLQDKDNGRKINPDAKLAALLKLKKNDELTYFNLQRYMSPHFFKAEKSSTV